MAVEVAGRCRGSGSGRCSGRGRGRGRGPSLLLRLSRGWRRRKGKKSGAHVPLAVVPGDDGAGENVSPTRCGLSGLFLLHQLFQRLTQQALRHHEREDSE